MTTVITGQVARGLAVAALLGATFIPACAWSQQPAATPAPALPAASAQVMAPPLLLRRFAAPGRKPGEPVEMFEIYDLGGGAYVIGGTHSDGVVVGDRGILVVDTRSRIDYPTMRAEIAKLSNKRILYVVGTHYHPDHVASLDLFRKEGAETITQANVPARMLAPPEPNPFTERPMDPAPVAALPTITFTDRMTLDLGGVTAQLIYVGPAHTDGDAMVWIPERNVIYAGDLVVLSYSPPDTYSGGSIDGLIRGADAILRVANDGTRIVSGHSRVMTRAEVLAFRQMMQTARDRVAAAKARGMTEDQVANAHLMADYDATWNGPGMPPQVRQAITLLFMRRVYRSLP